VHAVWSKQQQCRCGGDDVGHGQFWRDVQRVSGRPGAHVRRQNHQMLLRLRGVRGEISAGSDQDSGRNNERMPVSCTHTPDPVIIILLLYRYGCCI